ncbi:MAG: flavodoxin family protein [Armatimonadota bacterium]
MKLVAIIGSPHGMKGNTGMLLEGVLQGARDAGAEITLFSLANLDVQPCTACEGCHISGECPISDDFDTIKDAILQSDGMVFASPNYILTVTAQLKAFLDRCSGLIHLQAFEGKYAAAVVTSGSIGSQEVEDYLLRALRMTGCASVGSIGGEGWRMLNPDTRAPLLAAAAELGGKLVEAIRTKQSYPEQAAELQTIKERMRQLVTMQKDHWPYEYAAWSARGG